MENVIVDEKGLHLVTGENTSKHSAAKPFTTGYIESKNQYGFGYYECKMKITGVSGINNAFWLTTGHYEWTNPNLPNMSEKHKNEFIKQGKNTIMRTDEIDIVEANYPSTMVLSLHNWFPKSGSWSHIGGGVKTVIEPAKYNYRDTPIDLSQDYNLYWCCVGMITPEKPTT